MGLKKVFLDSCIVIYVIEAHPLFENKVSAELNALQDAQFVIPHSCVWNVW